MAKRVDNGQQLLRVITTIDDSVEKEHQDPNGQLLMFRTQKVLIPPGFDAFAEFMNNRLYKTEQKLENSTEQSRRLANSLETIISKFINQSVDNDKPDLVFGHMQEGRIPDVAIADSMRVVGESFYTLLTLDIVEKVGNNKLTSSLLGKILKWLGIQGDPMFHLNERTSKNGCCQKYKPQTVEEIYKRVANPSLYGLDESLVNKAKQYIRPQEGAY